MRRHILGRILAAVVISSLTTGVASAFETGAQAWTNYGTEMGEGDSNNGFNVDRLRILMRHNFNDDWSFSGKLEIKGGSTLQIKEAVFYGRNLFMDSDRFGLGAQKHPMHEFLYPKLGTRWISPVAGHDDGQFTPWSSGLSYNMKFGVVGATLFAASAESANNTDYDDREGEYSLHVTAALMDGLDLIAGYGVTTPNAAGADSESHMNVAVVYGSEMVDVGLEYYSTDTIQGKINKDANATKPDASTVYGLTTNFKLNDQYGFFANYFAGYEDTDSQETQVMVGPTAKFADGKIKGGVFYQMMTYNDDVTTAEDDSVLWVKMAAKFW